MSGIQYHPPLGKSDHSIIIFDYHCYLDYSKPKETFMYKKGDYKSMRDDLINSNWAFEFSEIIKTGDMSMEEVWNTLKSKLHQMRSIYVPKFTSTGKPSWNEKATFPISKQTREAIQLKKKSHRLWISCLDSTGDAALAYFQYARARNKVKSFIRRDKRNHEKKIAEQEKRNQKLFWSHTRRNLKTKQGPKVSPRRSRIRRTKTH